MAESVETAQLADALGAIEDELSYDIGTWWSRARDLERDAEAAGEPELVLRAQLIQADVRHRRGEIAAAAPVFWAVNRWAADHDRRPLLARSHLLLQRLYRDLGDAAAALDHSVRAMELLDDTTSVPQRVYHLMALAAALAQTGSAAAARERLLQAAELTARDDDVVRHMLVLNNLADAELQAGDPERALAAVETLRAVAAAGGRDLAAEPTYLGTIAEVQIALGRYAEAEETARAALEGYHAQAYDEAHALAYHLLTLATAQRHRGATDAAEDSLRQCAALCEGRDLGRIRVEVLRERAELQAAGGDPVAALDTYKAFHAADKTLVSAQREAQARTRQAMFETAEARQDAERFREQARRDPLTGLRNRRYVDERLPTLIQHSVETGDPVVVGLVDLDHFKRINDTFSHDVGDLVLVEIARLLVAALPAGIPTGIPAGAADGAGFVARMGGEEFLIVLGGVSTAEATYQLEDLRRTVADHPWQALTGALPVTVSVGVCAVCPDSTQAELLSRADASLYAAKHNGRNRVCVDPETSLVERRHYRDNRPHG